jgi:hypothetical protein
MDKRVENLSLLSEKAKNIIIRLVGVKVRIDDIEKRPALLKPSKQTQALFKKLSSNDNCEFPDSIEKVIFFLIQDSVYNEFFKNKLSEINKTIQPYYETFKETSEWIELSVKLLNEFIKSWDVPFYYETQIPILQDFMNVFANFGKIILLLNTVQEKRFVVTVYNLSYTKINGKTDPAISK